MTTEQALDLMASEVAVTFVAERDGQILAAGLATATGALGFIHRLTAGHGAEGDELAGRLLSQLGAALRDRGVRKFAVMAAEGDERTRFEAAGFKTVGGVRYLERSA